MMIIIPWSIHSFRKRTFEKTWPDGFLLSRSSSGCSSPFIRLHTQHCLVRLSYQKDWTCPGVQVDSIIFLFSSKKDIIMPRRGSESMHTEYHKLCMCLAWSPDFCLGFIPSFIFCCYPPDFWTYVVGDAVMIRVPHWSSSTSAATNALFDLFVWWWKKTIWGVVVLLVS